jgi:hypothetical protein
MLTVVSKNYFVALRAIHDSNEPRDMLRIIDQHDSLDGCGLYVSYIDRVENAFKKLDPISQKIINNDYFFNAYKYWNMELFSTSTYYRLKRKAILLFLSYFKI